VREDFLESFDQQQEEGGLAAFTGLGGARGCNDSSIRNPK
jgi:hypothetical protein